MLVSWEDAHQGSASIGAQILGIPMFLHIYQSAWLHPGAAFLLGALGTLLVLVFARRSLLLFAILELAILVDAALTGALSPLLPGGATATYAALLFVILGDLRYFYLVERQRNEAGRGRALFAATLLSLLVPIATRIVYPLAPERLVGNALYLLYELFMLGLVLGHFATRGRMAGERGVYVRRLFFFVLCQYALWAAADVLILRGTDAGWALRVVPNLLYYCGFAPFAVLIAPKEARA
jgi:hypothetical protein